MTLINNKIHFILLAAGNSTRFSKKDNKLLSKLNNKTLLDHNIDFILKQNFKKLTVVVDRKIKIEHKLKGLELIKGGSTRQESVVNALTKSKYNANYVIIHDCARPLFFNQLIKRIVRLIKTNKFDCIVPYSECSDTALFNGLDMDRKKLKLIKTPQAFKKKVITKLHKINKNINLTDDSQLFRFNDNEYQIKYLKDRYQNNKITFKEDLESINFIKNEYRIGLGYDIHRIDKCSSNNFINLGTLKIKSKINIISHSDGDVILHAITDSILGALSLRDIGTYFPNNKRNYKRNSVDFLNYALKKMSKQNYLINNIDIMLVSEEPRINPYYNQMIKKLCEVLSINDNQITIKATTNEKSGLIGESKFIACWSSISLLKN